MTTPVFVEPTDDELRELEEWLWRHAEAPEFEDTIAARKLTLAAKVVEQYRRRFRPAD